MAKEAPAPEKFPTLEEYLKSLEKAGKVASGGGGRVRILIDSREQLPFTFQAYDVTPEVVGLPVGDYSLPGFQDRAAVERKSLRGPDRLSDGEQPGTVRA